MAATTKRNEAQRFPCASPLLPVTTGNGPQAERLGGRGGSVPTDGLPASSLGTAETSLQAGNQNGEDVPLDEVLLQVGLWTTNRRQRQQFAGELALRGVTGAEVRLIAEEILSKAGLLRLGLGELVNLLRDDQRTREALEDLRKVAPKRQLSPGESIRRENMERALAAEREWQQYLADKQAGRLPPVDTRPMPWERARAT